MALYNGYGNKIEVSSSSNSNSDFGVTDYVVYEDNQGSARQGIITYQGKKLYVINHNEQRQYKTKNYNGGVMMALGDSYTSMASSYFSEFATKHGLVCHNVGLASSTIAGSEDGTTVGYNAFWKRLDEAITEYPKTINGVSYNLTDVKLITFMGGANDWTTVNDTVNRIGDRNSTDKEQLYGALNYIFDKLLNTFINADIVVILQPSNKSKGNNIMQLKEGIVREMAERYGLNICDCCFNWYNPSNPTDASLYWQSDDLHLTNLGNEKLFKKLDDTVNNLPFTRN